MKRHLLATLLGSALIAFAVGLYFLLDAVLRWMETVPAEHFVMPTLLGFAVIASWVIGTSVFGRSERP